MLAVFLVFRGVRRCRLRHQLANLFSQPLLFLLHPSVAHGLVLGGVGPNLRAVQGHVTQPNQPGLATQTQYLEEQSAQGPNVTATKLGDRYGKKKSLKSVSITLVDKNRTHIWKPKLHEVAAGSMDLADQELDYIAQAHWHHFKFRLGELIGIDRENKQIHVAPFVDL